MKTIHTLTVPTLLRHIYPRKGSAYVENGIVALIHLLQQNENYAQWMRKFNGYKILDNSVAELGNAFGIEQIANCAEDICANEIILPDVFGKCQETIDSAFAALDFLEERKARGMYPLISSSYTRFMAVVHGANIKEVEHCFETFLNEPRISVIGIPKILSTLHPQGRPYFEYLWMTAPKEALEQKDIHLLGIWDSFDELDEYVNPGDIRSVDTCLASYFAKYDTTIRRYGRYGTSLGEVDLLNDYIPIEGVDDYV